MSGPSGSPALFPNDHARTLIELLKGFGPEGSDLIRRWVVALLIVPEHERAEVVGAVEARISAAYSDGAAVAVPATAPGADASPVMYVTSGAVQRDGHTEEVERAYAPSARSEPDQTVLAGRRAGKGKGGASPGGAA